MVSSQGFQRSARRFAATYGIQLCTMRYIADGALLPELVVEQPMVVMDLALRMIRVDSSLGDETVAAFMKGVRYSDVFMTNGIDRRPFAQLLEIVKWRFIAEARDESITFEITDGCWLENRRTGERLPFSHFGVTYDRTSHTKTSHANVTSFFSYVLEGLVPGTRMLIAPDFKVLHLKDDQSVGMCDFCGYPIIRNGSNRFRSRIMMMRSADGRPNAEGFSAQFLSAEWGACDECAAIIRRLDPSALVRRHLDMGGFLENRKTEEEVAATHGAFWLGYLKEQSNNTEIANDSRFIEILHHYLDLEQQQVAMIDAAYEAEFDA